MPLKNLTKVEIIAGLERLAELAQAEGCILEISIYGGALMLLAYDARQTTKDVDAIFHPVADGKRLAAHVAQERGWQENWLNDDVRLFVSPFETRQAWKPPGLKSTAIKFTRPTAKYLLAMKVMACRPPLPGYAGDTADIAFLLKKMAIRDLPTIEAIVDQYFPDTVLPARTQATLQALLAAAATPSP